MIITLFMKGKKDSYYAEAVYDGKILVLKQGSRIRNRTTKGIKKHIVAMRNNKALANADSIVINDITFNSPSTAATFVSGTECNGYRYWKLKDQPMQSGEKKTMTITLSEYLLIRKKETEK
jgi:hypothetical protein